MPPLALTPSGPRFIQVTCGSRGRGRFGRVVALVVAALAPAGCDLVDVSFGDGGIVINPRIFPDGGVPGEGEGVPVPGPLPPGGTMPDPAPPSSANTACQRDLVTRGVRFAPAPAMDGRPPGRPDITCTVDDPVWIEPLVRGVTFRPARIGGRPVPIYAACTLGSSLGKMAEMLAERGVTDVVYLGVYGCRLVAGTSTLSEHGRGRAFDLAAVRTADGTVHTVLDHWERNQPSPVTRSGQLLRETVEELFEERVFNIILTPDYNADHSNHFHLDLTPDGHLFR
jgi:hypothetical protein